MLHFQGYRGGGKVQRLLHTGLQPFCDVNAEGGISPAGPSAEISGLDRAGTDILSVADHNLGVMSDHDLFCAPLTHHQYRLFPIRSAGQDFGFRRVGF